MADVSTNYVTLARHLVSSKDFGHALSMYMCAFSKQPRCLKRLENEFRAVLSKINEELDPLDNKTAILARFIVFPGNLDLLIEVGRCLYTYGYMSEALCHFEKALNVDSSYVSVEKNMNNAKAFLFPRNQFRILNDSIRNMAYRSTIRSCVSAADSVLVVDTGTGLLALYANECNPVAITACKSSNEMARLAECVMQDNYTQEVIILHGSSLTLNCTDIYFRRSVMLTDLVDSGLFGENILQTLCHAWENLLLPDAKIVPGKAEYFVAAIKCDELYKKYKLCQEMKNILNVTELNVHPSTAYGETYYSEDVHMYENVKYMCEPISLLTINFNSYQDIYEKLHRQEPYNAELTVTEDGEMNVVIGWFNLHLTDYIMLTSDPRLDNRASAYQQAIFFDVLPKRLHQNETVNIPFSTYGGRLTTLQDTKTVITRISVETLAYLNDTEYTSMLVQSVDAVCVQLRQATSIEEVDDVDLSPFPLFGILMLRCGANSLICNVKTADDEAFLHTVLVANSIPKSKVNVLVSEKWSLDIFEDKQFHVIFSHILNFNGDINVRNLWIVSHLKYFHLRHGGVCLPSSVTVMGQLIFSNYLEINNRILDDNVGYRLATRVHRYRVSQVNYLDTSRLDYEALSEVFEVASCEDLSTDAVKVPVLKDGECNAILCWYKVQLLEDWHEIYTNRNNSFVQSMAYMTGPRTTKIFKGDEANILKCFDPVDTSFKLVLNTEPRCTCNNRINR